MDNHQILEHFKTLIPEDRLITDKESLIPYSVDRFLKFPDVFGVQTRPLPLALIKAENTQEVSGILSFCNENGIIVIPRTGASSIEGGLEVIDERTIVLDGTLMNKILDIDTYNMQVTAQCGVILEELEQILRPMGYTTGHSPQSKPLAQIGGLVATFSTGQFSTLYGGIEDMLVGCEAVFPNGQICRIKNFPRRAAGPDIRSIIIGNEGALCYVTEATLKLFRYIPDNIHICSWVLHEGDMKTGFEILREVMAEGYKPSMTRLYDKEDGQYYFSHFCEGNPVLIFMTEGPKSISDATYHAIEEIVAKYPVYKRVDNALIEQWYAKLNWDPKKIEEERVEIKETHNVGFTTEIAANWSIVHDIYQVCVNRVKAEVPDLTLMGGHASHCYSNGTNIYFMYYYDVVDCSPEDEIKKYHEPINQIIVEETLRLGGSMCHHHGVGKHRTRWIREEYGTSWYMLKALKEKFDPNNIMNRGTVWPADYLEY
jgi:alkyldihydroxyacetonephosphate synthase